MIDVLKKYYRYSALRFLAVGFSNLIVVYAAYLAALQFTDYRSAYWFSFFVGLIYMAVLNIHHTFVRHLNVVSLIVYGVYYYAYAILNVNLIVFLVENHGVASELAPLVTLVVFLPLHYVLSKTLINRLAPSRE